jgi:NTP pyrophosphatase (non-canonical NTP hydrolase)
VAYENQFLWEYEDFVERGASDRVPEELKLMWALLGAGAELGEVQEVVEKALRKKGTLDDDDLEKLHDEIGDVIWYLTQAILLIDSSLEGVIQSNVDKLVERQRVKAEVKA